MANFAEFVEPGSNARLSVNPEHVTKVEPCPNGSGQTRISLLDGSYVEVSGEPFAIIMKLRGAS
jgi:hypothetical protein